MEINEHLEALPDEPVIPTTWTTPLSFPARASGNSPSDVVRRGG